MIGGGAVLLVYVLVKISAPKPPQKSPKPQSSATQTQRSYKKSQTAPRPHPVHAPKTAKKAVTSAAPKQKPDHENTITGHCHVVDGDTIRIGNVNLRLAGIDAPELDHPWGQKAKWELVALCKGHKVTAELEPDKSYDRVVATCYLPDGRDLSAEMVKCGLALDWPKFSGGKYSYLEPEGVRKKHWKAAARQRGHMSVFNK